MFKLLVPGPLAVSLDLGVGTDVVVYDSAQPLDAVDLDADGLVVWGNPKEQLSDCAVRMSRVRWIQTVAAGADPVVNAGFSKDVVITNGVGLHNGPAAEHALALILAAVRRIDLCVLSQRDHRWREDLRAISDTFDHEKLNTLRDTRVTICGLGQIGMTLAGLLESLGSIVVGVGRAADHRAGLAVVARGDLIAQLRKTDLLVMLLPSTPSTSKALDARHLRALAPHAWVVNLGRGSTIDEAALAEAVREQRISGCALDVFEEEPLPPSSPWWDIPNVIISPHTAGGRPIGYETMIKTNLAALLAGDPMRNVVKLDD